MLKKIEELNMKTNNFTLDLMVPNQEQKDITFNEALLKIDQFLNNNIDGFIDDVPEEISVGKKFIITKGEKKDYICFRSHESKDIEFLKPINNATFFSGQHQCFFTFTDNKWNKVNSASNFNQNPTKEDSKSGLTEFKGIQDQYLLPSNTSYHYIYLSGDSEITLPDDTNTEITLIIKQNCNSVKNLILPYFILWENKNPYKIADKANHMDVVKLFRIPGSFHFLGKVIAQNLTF